MSGRTRGWLWVVALLVAACGPAERDDAPLTTGEPEYVNQTTDEKAPAEAWQTARLPYKAADGAIQVFFTRPGVAPGEGEDPELDDELADAILTATSTVDLCLYEFNREVVFDAAVAAAERGVTIRFVGDGDEGEDEGYLALLEVGVGMSLRRPNDRIMHNKFGVIDGRFVFTGSTNVSDNGVLRNNNNFLIIDSEALAAAYTAEFEQMYTAGLFGRHKAPSAGGEPIDVGGLDVGLRFSPNDDVLTTVRQLLSTADHSVYFLIFSFTHPDISDDLAALHASGVEVVGVFDESQARGRYSKDEDLALSGLPVFIDGNGNASGFAGGKLHHKVMLIDAGTDSDPVVITGSYNWSKSASLYNDENIIVLRGAEVVQPFLEEFCARLGEATAHPDVADLPPDPCASLLKAVRVNEVLANPAGTDTNEEYVELVNAGTTPLDLAGWTLGDATRPDRHIFPKTLLAPGSAVVVYSGPNAEEPGRVLASSGSLSLTNNADDVELRDAQGVLVDRVSYRTARSGESFNRAPDGAEAGGFVLHGTLGAATSPGTQADGNPWVRFSWTGLVGINEVLPNPAGTDNGQEFVEIVNASPFEADLSGWTLADLQDVRHVFADGRLLAPGDALVVFDSGTHDDVPNAVLASTGRLSLTNTAETLTLRDADGEIVEVVSWTGSSDGVSLNRNPDGDPSGVLADHDGFPAAAGDASPGLRVQGLPWIGDSIPVVLVLNELLPNPDGVDAGQEFVEIVNAGEAAVDLGRFTLGDTSQPARHVFEAGTILAPGAALVVFDRGEHAEIPNAVLASTGSLSLTNTSDTITLRSDTGRILDMLSYAGAPNAVSLTRQTDGDPEAPFVFHDGVEGAVGPMSPGTRADGSAFGGDAR